MFDLESGIANWRRQMLAAGVQSPVPLDELENHLREEMEQQMKAGVTESEAFQIAATIIGQPQTVRGEFNKIASAPNDRSWKFKEAALLISNTLFPLWVVGTIFRFKPGPFSALTGGQQTSAFAAVVLFGLLGWSGRFGYRMLPVVRTPKIRATIGIACAISVGLWWIVFLNVIVPYYNSTVGQFTVAFLWGFLTPAGVMNGLVWGIETAARKDVAAAVS